MTHPSPYLPQVRRVRILGDRYSFHGQAALRFFPEGIELLPCSDIAALTQVAADEGAVVAVENRVVGPIALHQARLEAAELHPARELWLDIDLALVVRPGSSLDHLLEVRSHPVALAQCQGWLERHAHLRQVAWSDTSAAMQSLDDSFNAAAIGSARSAAELGLHALRRDIADHTANATRFVLALPKTFSSSISHTHNHVS